MSNAHKRIVVVAALLAAGCTVGPDFRTPDGVPDARYTTGPQPTQLASTGYPTQTLAPGDVPAQWWTLFRNPQLDETIRIALANSPTLTQASARLREAQENLASRTGATQFPQIDAKFDATRQQVNLQSVGITQLPSPGPFTLYNASVQVSYALDLFGGQRRELEGLQAAVDYQRYELEAARLSLAANVATTAIREAGLRAQLGDTVAIADAQRRQLGIMQQRLNLGGVARVDVQRQQSELAQTEALIPGLSQQIDATRHQLAVYTGQTPASAQLPEFRLEDLQLPESLPVSLPSELARRRPDIRAAEALLHQASANIGVATANLYPQITLTASGGTQEMRMRDLFSSFNIWSLAAGVVQPVFHGGELRAQKRAKEAAYEQSLGAYRQAVLQGLQNVADALRALDADAGTLQARADNAKQTRDTLAIVNEQYRLGGVSQFTVIDAERQARQATLDLAQARATRLADSAALMQALGGGWWTEEVAAR
ncbi:efflux transporter outer membrane subunit [Cupriavidus sp. SW-Y-13]|uniref:efflux transporter outer membrane subunit n=1 Tax=Cupriavidus sp. SW-Y-13 TaxID=2653854 RepID=UPI001365B096|nr:efflux transporter outer membrane subunit [Cupriavidus sp. SW-Y-13]MWL86183.1 efflux transporter outer membrane subunit [Cupriavidus sp. SW-Y-13]